MYMNYGPVSCFAPHAPNLAKLPERVGYLSAAPANLNRGNLIYL